jgi:uncharacterized lipoprotein YddW (UPF0748 family)
MKKLADAGFNTVFFRVARGANTIYPSKYLPRDEWVETFNSDELEKAIMAAHRNGLELHAWMVCWHVGGAAKQNGEAKKLYEKMAQDDRLVRDLAGKQAPFLSPADPRNQELELNVAREIVEKYDVDGIHLDYIRYPDEPHFDFDYGEVSRREFEKFSGQKVINWPRDVYSGTRKWDYENWERENINHLVQRVYAQTKQLKSRVLVSAAVWRAHIHNRATIKQDWTSWASRGWLDFVVPMDYTKDNAQLRDDVKLQVANAAGGVLLVAGIASYQHEDFNQTLKQIEIAREEGASGYALFDYKPQKYEALLAALKTGANQFPATPAFRAPRPLRATFPVDVLVPNPPQFQKGKTPVAIYAGGQADTGIERALKTSPALDAQRIHYLKPQFWQNAKVLVLPQLRDVAELSPDIVKALRDWVARGGVLLLTHDAVGFCWHLRAFPEIGEGVALSKSRGVEVLPNEFRITPGAWQHEFPDHVIIAPGSQGKVLAHEAGDATKPVLVGGSFGRGRVLLYGGLLGYAPDGTLDDGERNFFFEIAC